MASRIDEMTPEENLRAMEDVAAEYWNNPVNVPPQQQSHVHGQPLLSDDQMSRLDEMLAQEQSDE